MASELEKAEKKLADHIAAWAGDIAMESIEMAKTAQYSTMPNRLPPTIAAKIREMRNEDPERWDGMS